ncbi:aldo/keto reductase [Microlunatus flavus]|uniref:Predicted oxidoreductase n=1 Tax=Microlunatus flavus TaxID=1036181 RepID=A0A1H9CFN3_9ACTN|nr:aldo/keto reductase [Microlunatus flavus]SEP99563.1 Predicted oxidoreductase [Microlunatus flavus]
MTTPVAGTRRLGERGPEVSALGVGTWALGGPFTVDGRDAGWGEVDDDVSIAALHAAFDAGVTLVDSAALYGCGHSERVVGRALTALPPARRDQVVVATKFGNTMDEETRTGTGQDVSRASVRAECAGSLRRLGVEAIGLFQLHGGAGSPAQAEDVVATLTELIDEGSVLAFGTAQDEPYVVEAFAASPHCRSIQSQANVFGWDPAVLDAAHRHGLAVLARSPLAMGLLSGKYTAERRPAPGDVRLDTPWWDYFDEGAMQDWLARLDRVRELLTVGGRSLVQGSLAYLWALDPVVVPLPGIRTPAQAVENAGALAQGPLPADVADEVTRLLADSPGRRAA